MIVIGADAGGGPEIVGALLARDGEVRTFVSDPRAAATLRARGAKVALGDVSDGSHVGGAALGCFCAVLVAEATVDARERSFARTPAEVASEWADAIAQAYVKRAIWVGTDPPPPNLAAAAAEVVAVSTTDRSVAEVAKRVRALDGAVSIDPVEG